MELVDAVTIVYDLEAPHHVARNARLFPVFELICERVVFATCFTLLVVEVPLS